MVYNNKRYRCSPNAVTWDQAKTTCSNDGWRLAMPKDTHLLERLRHLCRLESVPLPYNTDWWKHPGVQGWERYTYWIGAQNIGGTFQYLDGSIIPSSLFYPGEPSYIGTEPQNCIQGNGKLDNDFCHRKRRFVCEQPVVRSHW